MSMTKHYLDTVTLEFNATIPGRRYVHVESGVVFKAVSTVKDRVLAKNLSYWAARCASDYITESMKPGESYDEVAINKLAAGALQAYMTKSGGAADSGIFVHDWLHAMVRGKTKPLPKNVNMSNACHRAETWYKMHTVEVVLSETPLCSLKLQMAGTPDLVAYVDGKLTIVDWKTGSGLYYDSLIQLAFYAIFFEEEFGIPIEQLILVNASMKSPFKIVSTTKMSALKGDAKAVYRLYKSMLVFNAQLERGDK
jgi:hypothetical protein